MSKKYYRACEKKGNKLLTLFHAFDGSRVLPVGEWLDADIKDVWDGSRKTATRYKSGFHVFEDAEYCREFINKMFRAERILAIVQCEVMGIRKKAHSRHDILLVDKIKLVQIIDEIKIKKL